MQWVFLVTAVLLEVCGTLALRVAANRDAGRIAWYAVVVSCYTASFGMLSLTLAAGVGVGVAYGIWAALGVATISVASRFLFHEALTPLMATGIALIVAGVLLVELGRGH